MTVQSIGMCKGETSLSGATLTSSIKAQPEPTYEATGQSLWYICVYVKTTMTGMQAVKIMTPSKNWSLDIIRGLERRSNRRTWSRAAARVPSTQQRGTILFSGVIVVSSSSLSNHLLIAPRSIFQRLPSAGSASTISLWVISVIHFLDRPQGRLITYIGRPRFWSK